MGRNRPAPKYIFNKAKQHAARCPCAGLTLHQGSATTGLRTPTRWNRS